MDCAPPPFQSHQGVADLAAAVEPVLARFPALRATLFQEARSLCLADTLHDARGYLEADALRIVIAADLPPRLQQAILIHELRHLQQQSAGTCPAPDLSMRENARAIFAMEADSSAYSLTVAWELWQDGLPDLWEALSLWPMQADIARTYRQAFTQNGNAAYAASAAFTQWYANPIRRESYYIAACSDYLEQLDRNHLPPGSGRLPPDFFRQLCKLPDGSPYPCEEAG
ncbi:DUF6782 family putative metallopeptidase [Sedimentimonas flavescens]|uniref:DUF6782 family putative metallopeptidase n=1 Tax=Sedimentimonas flavescens TaxID=2851012 RepID=UPI002E2B7A8C|nr:DUF6782 family putative metallopeptidase [Sedimentimonas flavescens]